MKRRVPAEERAWDPKRAKVDQKRKTEEERVMHPKELKRVEPRVTRRSEVAKTFSLTYEPIN